MDRASILELIHLNREGLATMGVTTLAIFGSVSRDEATASSDIDILINFDCAVTFDRYMDVKFFLEDLLSMRVDLVQEKTLRPLVRPFVEKDAIYVS